MSADDLARLGTERIARLAEIARELVSELRTDEVLDHLLDAARELTGARYAALGVLDEQRTALARFITSGVDDATRRLIGDPPRGRGVLGLLIEDPRPLRLHDVRAHPRSFGVPTGHPPISTFLGVPVVVRGTAWGNLYLADKADGADFTDLDEEIATILSRWAAIAIDNARLYETLDREHEDLARSVASLGAMTEIATALGAETELAPILDLIVKRARALVAARGVLVLLPEGDDRLRLAASAGAVAPTATSIPVAGTRSGEVLRTGEPLRIDDVGADGRSIAARLGAPDASTALLVPMSYRKRVVGVLVAIDRRAGAATFREQDEELLRAFASSAATAVVTAQSVEVDRLRAAVQAADAERARWARELHDETLQTLGGLHVLLAGAAYGGDGQRLREAVAIAAERVADEIAALRALVAELRPAALDELGLGPALTSLVRRVAGGEGLTAVADVDLGDASNGDHLLAPDLETAVYRVAQEALTNVAKHAHAQRVELHVTKDDDSVALSVVDDGDGFDVDCPPDASVVAPGYGLAGMRERVMLAGGALTVDSAPGGTTVSARFPLGGAQAPAPSAASSRSPRSSA